MRIGELARKTGTQVETLRFYERQGLLPAPARTSGNYRLYGDSHVERVSFIRHCRNLDIALAEIRELLRFKDAPAEECGGVDALLEAHIDHVVERIRELRKLQRQLETLRERCMQVRSAAQCGILVGLVQGPSESRPVRGDASHVRGAHPRQLRTRS